MSGPPTTTPTTTNTAPVAATRHSLPPATSYPLLTSPPASHHPSQLATLSLSLPPTSFIFSASPLLFHPRSSSIALVHDIPSDSYFLPRGRKDVGESLPACALREGFEESGFCGELISWGDGPGGTRQPSPSVSSMDQNQLQLENKEAFWVQAQPHFTRSGVIMYFTHYFLAVLPEDDPAQDKGKERLVGKHERGYEGVLVPVEEAIRLLCHKSNGLVFVADQETEVRELVRSGKIWKGEDKDEDRPAWEDDAEGGGQDVWKSGPVRESKTFRIDKDTAHRLAKEGKGRLVPCPKSGVDDQVVQAGVVYQGWKRLKEVHKWK